MFSKVNISTGCECLVCLKSSVHAFLFVKSSLKSYLFSRLLAIPTANSLKSSSLFFFFHPHIKQMCDQKDQLDVTCVYIYIEAQIVCVCVCWCV